MSRKIQGLALLAAIFAFSLPLAAGDDDAAKVAVKHVESARSEAGVLWRDPADIASRNLFYGPGGEKDAPHGPYKFEEEDMKGTNPKFIVKGPDKTKWTVKLGLEARPETAASRLVWAVGYFTNEDYFLPEIQIDGMPAHVKRGGKEIGPNGTIHSVRLKRHLSDEKDLGNWSWRDGAYTGTRELNGLKVMMALINNWDLKDVNTAIYGMKDGDGRIALVSDLGASFGATGLSFPFKRSKDDLKVYEHSKFIGHANAEFVDFRTPSRPALIYLFKLPDFMMRVHMEQVTHRVPREDAKWMGGILAKLSEDQIKDSFRASGYNPDETQAFTRVVEARIAELTRL